MMEKAYIEHFRKMIIEVPSILKTMKEIYEKYRMKSFSYRMECL
jgi:hypothetical protein